MSKSDDQVTRVQERTIDALLNCKTGKDAALKAGVSERTLRYWMKQRAFLRAYRDARRQLVEHSVSRLQKASAKAVATLVKNLRCGRPGDEIRAAALILEHGARGVELIDLEERLSELESRLAEEKP